MPMRQPQATRPDRLSAARPHRDRWERAASELVTNGGTYDPIGRRYYAGVRHQF